MIPTAAPASVAPEQVDAPLPAAQHRRHRRTVLFALAPLMALALLVAILVGSAREPVSVDAAGTPAVMAPSFERPDLRNPAGVVRFGSPTRPTVVNFFAAWCVPCRAELPLLGNAARTHTGVDFVGVDVQDIRADALSLLAETRVEFPVAVDRDKSVARQFGLVGMPATYFIAAGGAIVAEHKGELSSSDLRRLLAELESR